jgi:hypothetical protein
MPPWNARCALVYRDFTRVGSGKMPDAKSMGRCGLAIGPQVLRQIHDRMVKIAHDNGVVAGRRMRVDTTVVESNIHHPTDSTLLGDGVRVLTRTMKKITDIVGAVGTRLRDRSRSVKLRLFEIAPRLAPGSTGTRCHQPICGACWTASRRARATIAFFIPRRLAICMAQALSQDHFFERNMLCAAS